MEQNRLWAGTASGLLEVDPRTDQYTQTLPYETAGGISVLLPLGDSRLWAEADRGHFYYDGHQWFQVQISGLTKNFRATAAMIDQHGDLLVRHITGNSRESRQYHLPGHIPPSDRPWTATSEGLNWGGSVACPWQAFTDGFSSYRSAAECEAQNQAITTVSPDGINTTYALTPVSGVTDMDGSVWWVNIESSSNILNHISNGRWITFTLPPGYNSYSGRQFFYPLAPDPVHGVWRGDRQGLIYTDGENTRRIDFAYDPCTVFWPNDLTIDVPGTIWLGTADGRILKQTPTDVTWASVPLPDLTPAELKQPIVAITTSPAGILWATHGHDLFNVGEKTTRIESTLPDAKHPLAHLIATADSVWGWSYWGIWQFNVSQQKWLRHDLYPKLVSLLIVDSNGTIYAGGWNGLYSYVDSVWRQVATVDVTVAAADKQGGLWLASGLQGDLWYYKAGQLTTLGQRFNPNGVWHLTVDKQNRLWAAYPDVLVRYDGKNWRYIHSPVLGIDRITASPDGRIWITDRRSTGTLKDASIAVYDPAHDTQP